MVSAVCSRSACLRITVLSIEGVSLGLPWQSPTYNLDNLLGQIAFALFFMISAYLFWGRVLKGNAARLSWLSFLQGRVYRLAPMYFVAILLLLIIVAVETGFTLQVPVRDLAMQILRWCSFTFFGTPDINGLHDTNSILSTIWTLRFEWAFYIGLPVMAYAYFKTEHAWPVYILFVGYSVLRGWSPLIFFAGGCIAAEAMKNYKAIFQYKQLWLTLAVCSLIALIACFHDLQGLVQACLLLPLFLGCLLATGSGSFLMTRPLRFLGHISYSVYLLHNPILHIFVKGMIGYPFFAHLNPYQFGAAVFGVGLSIIAISTVTFLSIEKPFMLRGKHVAQIDNLAYAGGENAIQPLNARSQS